MKDETNWDATWYPNHDRRDVIHSGLYSFEAGGHAGISGFSRPSMDVCGRRDREPEEEDLKFPLKGR